MSENFWIGLLKRIWGLITFLLKRKSESKEEEFQKVQENLQKKYNKIDDKKEHKKSGDLKKRLDNMF